MESQFKDRLFCVSARCLFPSCLVFASRTDHIQRIHITDLFTVANLGQGEPMHQIAPMVPSWWMLCGLVCQAMLQAEY